MPCRCKYSFSKSLAWLLGLAGVCLATQAGATSNQCLDYFPDNVTSASDVRVCSSSFSGDTRNYICRDYVAGDVNYRVLYNGGLTPKAILKFDEKNHLHLVWSPASSDQDLNCPLAPPEGIPFHAKHRGIGVCHDDDNEPVPCSVYEHAAPRHSQVYRYFAIHDANGEAPAEVDKLVAGNNVNAVEAELSFQIGMSLLATDCCREQGLEYLKHAYELFPYADTYRIEYYRKKGQLAAR